MNSRRVQFIVDDHTPAPASSVQAVDSDWPRQILEEYWLVTCSPPI